MQKDYVVVFEFTAAAGAKKGVRVISHFDSKEEFEKLYDDEWKETEKVVAQGVSSAEAQRLLRGMSIGGLVRATLEEFSAMPGLSNERARDLSTMVVGMSLREIWGFRGPQIREI